LPGNISRRSRSSTSCTAAAAHGPTAALRASKAAKGLVGNTIHGNGQGKLGQPMVVDNITKKGTIIFRAGQSAIRAAVDSQLPICFADPLLERKRQELLSNRSHSVRKNKGKGIH
jgi:hypothetical protein